MKVISKQLPTLFRNYLLFKGLNTECDQRWSRTAGPAGCPIPVRRRPARDHCVSVKRRWHIDWKMAAVPDWCQSAEAATWNRGEHSNLGGHVETTLAMDFWFNCFPMKLNSPQYLTVILERLRPVDCQHSVSSPHKEGVIATALSIFECDRIHALYYYISRLFSTIKF